MQLTIRIIVALLTFAIGVAASQLLFLRQPTIQVISFPSPAPEVSTTAVSTASAIRLVNFANHKYPNKPIYGDRGSFELQHGIFNGRDKHEILSLAYLDYGDVTGDGNEEAFVVLNLSVRGSAIPHFVYLYTLRNGNPELLWAFATGDRADGGLRQVRSEEGKLVIELFGKGKIVGGNLFAEDGMTGGACCPTHFTRVRYEWRGSTFKQQLGEEILHNPNGGASVVMKGSDY